MNSDFKIIALGGLDENGKNSYILETKNEMVLIDAGSSNFSNKALGIDTVIPDFSYVYDNIKKLKAVFISHGHFDQMGSLPMIISELKVPVYGSVFTIEFLKYYVKKVDHKYLNVIKYNDMIKFDEINVDVFSLSHAIYGNYGFCFSFEKDAVIYATDYNFDQVENKFARSDIAKIVSLKTKYNIRALMTESVSAENEGMAGGDQTHLPRFKRFIQSANQRIVISLYSSNLAGMRNIMKLAQEEQRKIVIIGRDLLNYVNIARNLGYIEHQKELFIRIPDMKKYDENQLIVVVSGLYLDPFLELSKMSNNLHNIITLKDTDSVLIASKPNDESEAMAQSLLDSVARSNCSITHFKINVASHAYGEDIKMLINLLEPQIIIPVKGEYRKFNQVKNLAMSVGIEKENIHLLKNGDIFEIYNDYAVVYDTLILSDRFLTSHSEKEIEPIILKDREVLSDNGFLLIIMSFDKATNKLVQKPELVSGGLSKFDDKDTIDSCISAVLKEIDKGNSNKEMVNKIKNKLSRVLQNKIGKTPMILPVRMEVDLARLKGKNGK